MTALPGRRAATRLPVPQIVAVLGVLITAVAVGTPIIRSRIREHRLVSLVAPSLEQEFGFRAAYEPIGTSGDRVYRLVEVVPQGRLARAGALPGDRPAPGHCRYAGDDLAAEYFLDALKRAKAGAPVQVLMARGPASASTLHTLQLGSGPGQP